MNPTNIMGTSKRISEMIVLNTARKNNTLFSDVLGMAVWFTAYTYADVPGMSLLS